MQMRRNARRRLGRIVAVASALALTAGPASGSSPVGTQADALAGSGYETVALWSVGETVPRTSEPSEQYRMVGTPDGMGARQTASGSTLWVNHEFTTTTLSNPIVDGSTYEGALVSRLKLDGGGNVVTGDLAYEKVYQDNTYAGRAATTTNSTPAFGRLCSGSFAGPEVGFTHNFYLTNEESDAAGSFDGRGGQTVAIFNNQAHALSGMGHFSKENTIAWPNEGRRTMLMVMEDGPSTPDSQLWMYVGRKSPDAGSVLGVNGLVGGRLFVFVSTTAGRNSDKEFTSGSITGKWVAVPDAATMNEVELEAAADALGAFAFIRPEDGAFAKENRYDFFFDTTGGNAAEGNELGRLYHLRLDQDNILNPSRLDVVVNADTVVGSSAAPTGDIALSPDNIDTSEDYLMVQEDGTTQSRAVFGLIGREAGIWRFELNEGPLRTTVDASSATRVVELTPPGQDGIPVPTPGTWETSGIIDTSSLFGPDTWLFNVQAHAPTTAPVAGTVEDGQLLLLRPASV